MDRRANKIIRVVLFAALGVGILPVIPVGEVLAPAPPHTAMTIPSQATSANELSSGITELSPLANASTLDKLRHLFGR